MESGDAGPSSTWSQILIAIIGALLTMTAAELGEITVQIGLVLQRRPGPPTVASEPGIAGVHHVGAALSSASTARPEPQSSLEVAPVWCVCARKCFACGRDWCSEPRSHEPSRCSAPLATAQAVANETT